MSRKTRADRARNLRLLEQRLGGAPSCELPVFYNEQDRRTTEPCSYLTREEAWAQKRAGEGKFVDRGLAFQLNRRGPAPPLPRFTASLSSDSAASVSVNEVRANVGEPPDTPGAEIPRHVVQRAQAKIRAIGGREEGTFDTRAPLAFGAPSWPVASNPGA